MNSPEEREALIDRLSQEVYRLRRDLQAQSAYTDREAARVQTLREAILEARGEGCMCDWHLYNRDADLLTNEGLDRYLSELGHLQAALLAEGRKVESLEHDLRAYRKDGAA